MKKGGRSSASSREISTLAKKVGEVQIIDYPDAPYELSETESFIWKATVQDKSPDWFTPSNFPLLKQYCRHVARADQLAEMIRQYEEDMVRAASGQATIGHFDIEYRDLLLMEQAASRSIAMLSTKMRLAQQSSIDNESAKNRVGKKSNLWLTPKS